MNGTRTTYYQQTRIGPAIISEMVLRESAIWASCCGLMEKRPSVVPESLKPVRRYMYVIQRVFLHDGDPVYARLHS